MRNEAGVDLPDQWIIWVRKTDKQIIIIIIILLLDKYYGRDTY